jgi:hypothetical protein
MLQIAKNKTYLAPAIDQYIKKGDQIVKKEISDMKKLAELSKRRQNLKEMLQNQSIASRANNSGIGTANTNSRQQIWNNKGASQSRSREDLYEGESPEERKSFEKGQEF